MTTLTVDQLQVGDRFVWCDRIVTVTGFRRATTYRHKGRPRPSRRVVTAEHGALHYYDDEAVVVV